MNGTSTDALTAREAAVLPSLSVSTIVRARRSGALCAHVVRARRSGALGAGNLEHRYTITALHVWIAARPTLLAAAYAARTRRRSEKRNVVA